MTKRLYILAGANGSGKSTVSKVLLPAESLVYVNPDDIARELNPGGHFVPPEDVRRRYARSKANFLAHYRKAVDRWMLVYNGYDRIQPVAEVAGAEEAAVYSESLYKTFMETMDHE